MSDADTTVRLRLDVAYDGSGFHGFAENRDVVTVGGTLRAALERVLHAPVEITCAGRTDAGVHARGQVVTLDVPVASIDALARRDRRGPGDGYCRLRDALNALVGPSVVVTAVSPAADDFDARFSARSRTYRYTVWSSEVPDPFLATSAWWVDQPLDLDAMRTASEQVVGEHDFSCFCRRPRATAPGAEPVSLVRRVLSARWDESPERPGLLTFTISATAFCHQMVRSITGMVVDVGRGRRTPDDVTAALASLDRARAGQLAPPHGLVLWEVGY